MGDAGLAEVACTTVGILTIYSQTAEPVLAVRGLEALVFAMDTHQTDPAVQQEACEAVASLLSQSDAVVLDGGAVGCVRSVVRALQRHAAVEGVCRQGCWALGTLALDSANEEVAVQAGGIQAVVVRVCAPRAHVQATHLPSRPAYRGAPCLAAPPYTPAFAHTYPL